jgi:hypothetical protein
MQYQSLLNLSSAVIVVDASLGALIVRTLAAFANVAGSDAFTHRGAEAKLSTHVLVAGARSLLLHQDNVSLGTELGSNKFGLLLVGTLHFHVVNGTILAGFFQAFLFHVQARVVTSAM